MSRVGAGVGTALGIDVGCAEGAAVVGVDVVGRAVGVEEDGADDGRGVGAGDGRGRVSVPRALRLLGARARAYQGSGRDPGQRRPAQGGAKRGGVFTYFAGRTGTMVQMFLLSPGNAVCVSVWVTIFTAVLSKLHVRMEPALDDLPTYQICSVKPSRRVRVWLPSKASELSSE